MLILITGGAASGKSELAEHYCRRLRGRLLYIATMRPLGDGAEERVARHRALRAGKGFQTVERYTGLEKLELPFPDGTVLLECIGNLVANEQFEARVPPRSIPDKVDAGVQNLLRQAAHVVVVSNDIFGDATRYKAGTRNYLRCMGAINARMARRADLVVESVCGLEYVWKGRGLPV